MRTAGRMKARPAATRPMPPARWRPMWIAISVEFGPGIRLVAPRRSRNSSLESQRRRRTTSSSIIAMCAAGPPNAVLPRRRNREATSFSAPGPAVTGSGETAVPGCSSGTLRRQHEDLPAHVRLVHRAVEGEQPLPVEGEHVGGLLQRWQHDAHEDVARRIDQHEVVLVIGLKVAEADHRRLALAHGEE